MKTGRISTKAVFALFFYIIIPTTAILSIMINYPELSKSRFFTILRWIVPIGIVLIIISQVQVFFGRGTKQRLLLNIAYTGTAILWVLALLGGRASITHTWKEYEFSLHIWRLLLIIISVSIVNIFYFLLEYHLCKEDIKAENKEIVTDDINCIPTEEKLPVAIPS